MIENDVKTKEVERIILNLQVKEFLSRGGQIKQYPCMPDLKPKDLIDIYAERYSKNAHRSKKGCN